MFGAVSTLRFSFRVCLVLALSVGWPMTAAAADDEASTRRRDYLSLDHLDAYLAFEAEYTDTRVKTRDRTGLRRYRTQENRDCRLEERLGLELGGSIIDSGFITYHADLSFGLTQNRFEEKTTGFPDGTESDDDHLLQYDARLNLLPGNLISGSVYALRQDFRIPRRFQPTLDEERTGFGTSWVFAHEKVPMELTYDYLETERTGNRAERDDEHFIESTLHFGADWLIDDDHHVKFSYEHAETKQDYQGLDRSFDTTRDLFEIEHELRFGPEHRHDVRTLIHWQEESGDFARDFFEIGPELTLRHSDALQTMYKYQFNRERYEGLDIETQRVDLQLVHQWYANLTTTVDAFGLYEDIEDDINTVQYGASVDWQYNRKNPYGHFYANLALAYDTEEIDGDDGWRVVLDESATFLDPIPIILRNRDVVQSTIVVTDPTNRRIYQIGVDYLVYAQGNVTRIARLRGGRIADRTTVLIDYQYRTPQRGQLDTVRADLSLEQRFDNGLTPYYRFSYRNQEDDTSFGFARRADRTDHHRLGVTFEKKRFSLGAEAEIFDDTIEPYDAFHLNGLLHVLQGTDHHLDLSSRLSRMYFEGGLDDRDVTLVDVEMDHRWRLTETLSTVERIAYRFEDDSVAGDVHAWDVVAGLEYASGDLSGELTFEYDRLRLPESDEENYGVFFRIRKDIPNVLGNWQ